MPARSFVADEREVCRGPTGLTQRDPVLLQGGGCYTDDLNLPGQLYGVMLRSRMAHGELRSIDADAARAMPESIFVDIDHLPAVTTASTSAAPGALRAGHVLSRSARL
jgi:CO/xanthine dehydrogenase Mo-binding subunit